MDSIIKAENLVFYYTVGEENAVTAEKPKAAVKGVSLEIERGSFTAIIGHNGSGKSTLAKLLSGILEPTSGSVLVKRADGRLLECNTPENNFEVRKTVGMVFQNPDNQLVASIVEDDVAFAPENLGIAPTEIRKRVDECLEMVGLSEYAGHDTHKLSGGQKQRVAVAGILAMRPECIIFDEATAMLDPRGRADIMSVIKKLKAQGVTVVLITHYMNEAALADRVVVIDGGEKVCEGTPRCVFAEEELLERCRLETPQSTALVRKLNADLNEEKMSDSDCVINTEEAVEKIEMLLKKHGVKPKTQPRG